MGEIKWRFLYWDDDSELDEDQPNKKSENTDLKKSTDTSRSVELWGEQNISKYKEETSNKVFIPSYFR